MLVILQLCYLLSYSHGLGSSLRWKLQKVLLQLLLLLLQAWDMAAVGGARDLV
jgi:hypothetical protein